jgi:hypothetical protein
MPSAETTSSTRITAPTDAPDAFTQWAAFALDPLSLETPAAWYPRILDWTASTAKVRWETLTNNALELQWRWLEGHSVLAPDLLEKRLESAWTLEEQGAEKRAKDAQVDFTWKGKARPWTKYLGQTRPGTMREYKADGLPGVVAVVGVEQGGRQALVSIACCPPAGHDSYESVIRRVLRSLEIQPEGAPLQVRLHGVAVTWPGDLRISDMSSKEGQFYLEAKDRSRRLNLFCLPFASFYEQENPREKVWSALSRQLFDRGDQEDTLTMLLRRTGRPLVEPEAEEVETGSPKADAGPGSRHAGGRFDEQRGRLMKMGDWVIRRLGRRWQGQGTVLAWTCAESGRAYAVGARHGAEDSQALAREGCLGVACHGVEGWGRLNWGTYILAEAQPPRRPNVSKKKAADAKPEQAGLGLTPFEHRRVQLNLRLKPCERVEYHEREEDGATITELVFLAYPVSTALGRMVRGRAEEPPREKRLKLDLVGRQVWDGVRRELSVGEILAELCWRFSVHPVELFSQLLAFLKTLGDKGLVEGAVHAEEPPAVAH